MPLYAFRVTGLYSVFAKSPLVAFELICRIEKCKEQNNAVC